MTSEREKLVEAVAKGMKLRCTGPDRHVPDSRYVVSEFDRTVARAALAVAYEWLREVTPAMVEAWMDHDGPPDEAGSTEADAAAADWLAMLNASPLGEGQLATVRKTEEL